MVVRLIEARDLPPIPTRHRWVPARGTVRPTRVCFLARWPSRQAAQHARDPGWLRFCTSHPRVRAQKPGLPRCRRRNGGQQGAGNVWWPEITPTKQGSRPGRCAPSAPPAGPGPAPSGWRHRPWPASPSAGRPSARDRAAGKRDRDLVSSRSRSESARPRCVSRASRPLPLPLPLPLPRTPVRTCGVKEVVVIHPPVQQLHPCGLRTVGLMAALMRARWLNAVLVPGGAPGVARSACVSICSHNSAAGVGCCEGARLPPLTGPCGSRWITP